MKNEFPQSREMALLDAIDSLLCKEREITGPFVTELNRIFTIDSPEEQKVALDKFIDLVVKADGRLREKITKDIREFANDCGRPLPSLIETILVDAAYQYSSTEQKNKALISGAGLDMLFPLIRRLFERTKDGHGRK